MTSIDPIRARLAAATPGPWEIIGGGEYLTGVDIHVGSAEGGVRIRDAEFIAAAPADIARLLAAVEALEKIARELVSEITGNDGLEDEAQDELRSCAAKRIRAAIASALEGNR